MNITDIEWKYPRNIRHASLPLFDTHVFLEEDINTNRVRLTLHSWYWEPYDKYQDDFSSIDEVITLLNGVYSRKELRDKLKPQGQFRDKDKFLGISEKNLKDGLLGGGLDKEDYDKWSHKNFFKKLFNVNLNK